MDVLKKSIIAYDAVDLLLLFLLFQDSFDGWGWQGLQTTFQYHWQSLIFTFFMIMAVPLLVLFIFFLLIHDRLRVKFSYTALF